MKAILVVDMPSGCEECPFRVFPPFCSMSEIAKKDAFEECEKEMPSWCPLRPLPREWTMDEVEPCAYNEGFVDGLNHCIYLITGETK